MTDPKKNEISSGVNCAWRKGQYDPTNQRVTIYDENDENESPEHMINLNEGKVTPLQSQK